MYFGIHIFNFSSNNQVATIDYSRQNFQEYRAQRSEFLEYQKNEKNVTALDFSDSENFSGFSLKSATMAQIFLRHIQYSINDGKLSGQKVHHH